MKKEQAKIKNQKSSLKHLIYKKTVLEILKRFFYQIILFIINYQGSNRTWNPSSDGQYAYK